MAWLTTSPQVEFLSMSPIVGLANIVNQARTLAKQSTDQLAAQLAARAEFTKLSDSQERSLSYEQWVAYEKTRKASQLLMFEPTPAENYHQKLVKELIANAVDPIRLNTHYDPQEE